MFTFKIDSRRKIDIPLLFILVLFYTNIFVSIAYLSDNSLYKYISLFLIALFLLFNYRYILRKENLTINVLLLILIGLILISGYVNRNNSIVERDTFLASIVFCVRVVEIFFLIEYLIAKQKLFYMLNVFYFLTFIFIIITDILVFTIGPKQGGVYLIGTKFSVSYLHLQFLILFLIRAENKRFSKVEMSVGLTIAVLFTLFITSYVHCSTGTVGVFILLLFLLIRGRKKFLISPVFTMVLMVLSIIFVVFVDWLLSLEFIRYIIVDLLKEDLTLTNRTRIFESITEIMSGHWLWGWGYGSEYDVVIHFVGAADIQNGLTSFLLNSGIFATFIFLALVCFVFSCSSKEIKTLDKNNKLIKMQYLAACMIFVYIVLATVEITLSTSFLLWVAVLFGITRSTNYLNNFN